MPPFPPCLRWFQMVAAGFCWLEMVGNGFRWFQMVGKEAEVPFPRRTIPQEEVGRRDGGGVWQTQPKQPYHIDLGVVCNF